jgi:putative membrane protein
MRSFSSCLAATLMGLLAGAAWAAAGRTAPTDPQIAAIVLTANQIDIDAGKLAKERSKTKDVKAFAERMINDHSGVSKATDNLTTKLKVTPEVSDTTLSLQRKGDESLDKLKKLEGHDFDKAYIDHEVAYQEAVLKAIDKTLIPNAKNTELKALLVKVRPTCAAHLASAKSLQAELAR